MDQKQLQIREQAKKWILVAAEKRKIPVTFQSVDGNVSNIVARSWARLLISLAEEPVTVDKGVNLFTCMSTWSFVLRVGMVRVRLCSKVGCAGSATIAGHGLALCGAPGESKRTSGPGVHCLIFAYLWMRAEKMKRTAGSWAKFIEATRKSLTMIIAHIKVTITCKDTHLDVKMIDELNVLDTRNIFMCKGPYCGTIIHDRKNFCHNCGKPDAEKK